MDVVVGTPERIFREVWKVLSALSPNSSMEVRTLTAGLLAGVLQLSSVAFVSPHDEETIFLVGATEAGILYTLRHEAVHVTLHRLGERQASKRLDLLVALGRDAT